MPCPDGKARRRALLVTVAGTAAAAARVHEDSALRPRCDQTIQQLSLLLPHCALAPRALSTAAAGVHVGHGRKRHPRGGGGGTSPRLSPLWHLLAHTRCAGCLPGHADSSHQLPKLVLVSGVWCLVSGV